jgi:enoyl-CoA hydratase/carnithine racemase
MTTSTRTRRKAPAPAAAPDILLRATADGITTLTLNRPEARNCLSEAMFDNLQAALDELADDKATRVIVLAANGPVFCSGHDLKEMTARRADADGGRAFFTMIMDKCARMMTSVVRSPKPVIARVHGTATAAGCQLVASCDLAVAAKTAQFATPGVHIGLFCSTPMVALSRAVPRKQAMEMLLTGEAIDAQTALRLGLVNRLAPTPQVMEEALDLAVEIVAKSPLTLKIGKQAFHQQAELGLAEAYDYASQVMTENMMALDAQEGIDAFLQKRKPEWKGC